MLCVFHHIRDNVFKNSNGKIHIQVNNFIKAFHDRLSEKDLNKTIDTFWSEFTKFNHKNDPFESNEFIYSSKYICDGNSHL